VPIPGTTSLERLHENVDGTRLEFSAEDLKEIDSALLNIAVYGERYSQSAMKNIDR
jgi:aryl-alcohol dehydrogenase-like predicted oxidoreductase